ncbi:MAG TPA: hypothetical protein VFT90_15780, partial [Chryseosolibacter sp.]|nr:hypothetical protein [Chryseosolibacter sp.]
AAALFYKYVILSRFSLPAGREAVVWLCLLLLPLVLVTLLHPNFNIDRLLTVIVSNNSIYNDLSEANEYVEFNNLTPTPVSILIHSPWALFSGLFRPLPWETSSFVQVIQGIENSALLLLSVAALWRVGRYSSSQHRLLMLALITFVAGTCIFITLSAPNFGTLSRYRVGYISFYALLILSANPLIGMLPQSGWRMHASRSVRSQKRGY